MSGIETQNYEFSLVGGDLSLDFSNTVGGRSRLAPERPRNEHLTSYGDLVAWARQAGVVQQDEAETLLAEAARRPEEAHAVLERAISLREAIYGLFSSVAPGAEPPPEDLDRLNEELAQAAGHLRVLRQDGGFVRDWAPAELSMECMLWPVAWSASDLLTGEELRRVRECANDGCGWLFVDQSRNRSRQWCDMKDCGNRAKARRHYHRRRGSDALGRERNA